MHNGKWDRLRLERIIKMVEITIKKYNRTCNDLSLVDRAGWSSRCLSLEGGGMLNLAHNIQKHVIPLCRLYLCLVTFSDRIMVNGIRIETSDRYRDVGNDNSLIGHQKILAWLMKQVTCQCKNSVFVTNQ